MKSKIIAGTRGSELALAQTNYVINSLKQYLPGIKCEIRIIKTSGDIHTDKSVFDESLKDMFVKEIELALLNNEIDFAVHSMKDLPGEITPGLVIGAVPHRESVNDVLISKNNIKLNEFKKDSVIGTSSLRRKYQLLDLNPGLIIKEIRGNIHTRINKINNGYDAVILAHAGINRLNLNDRITEIFSIKQIVPAPGQGALCVQCRKNDFEILDILSFINNKDVFHAIEIERKFSKEFDAGCKAPIGAFACINNEDITLTGMFYKNDILSKKTIKGSNINSFDLVKQLVNNIRNQLEEKK